MMQRSKPPRLIIENKPNSFRVVAEGHIAWAVIGVGAIVLYILGR